jgi:hypothetical protein
MHLRLLIRLSSHRLNSLLYYRFTTTLLQLYYYFTTPQAVFSQAEFPALLPLYCFTTSRVYWFALQLTLASAPAFAQHKHLRLLIRLHSLFYYCFTTTLLLLYYYFTTPHLRLLIRLHSRRFTTALLLYDTTITTSIAWVMPYYYEGQKKKKLNALRYYCFNALRYYEVTNALLLWRPNKKKLCGSSPILISLVNFMSIAGIWWLGKSVACQHSSNFSNFWTPPRSFDMPKKEKT